jgi:hypothetical protein
VVTRLAPAGVKSGTSVCHVAYIDVKASSNAIDLAREAADTIAREFKCDSSKVRVIGATGRGVELALPLVSRRNKSKCPRPARWFSSVAGVIDAIHDRHLGEIERAYPVQAGHIDGIQALVRSPLMMRIYTAAGAEEVLRRASVETIARQDILALQKFDPTRFRHHNDRTTHPAVGAGAAADRIEAIAEGRLEPHGTAMALPDRTVVSPDMPPVSRSDRACAQSR